MLILSSRSTLEIAHESRTQILPSPICNGLLRWDLLEVTGSRNWKGKPLDFAASHTSSP